MEFLLTFYLFNLATSLFRQLKTKAEDFPTFYEAPVSVMQFFLQFLCMSKWFFYIWGGIPWYRWNQRNRQFAESTSPPHSRDCHCQSWTALCSVIPPSKSSLTEFTCAPSQPPKQHCAPLKVIVKCLWVPSLMPCIVRNRIHNIAQSLLHTLFLFLSTQIWKRRRRSSRRRSSKVTTYTYTISRSFLCWIEIQVK